MVSLKFSSLIFLIPFLFLNSIFSNLNLSHTFEYKCSIQENFSMRCLFLYLFICYLTALFLLSEYAQRKGKHIITKTLLCKSLYLFILLLLLFLPYTNFRALHNRLKSETP
jgi:hypothetical protein